MAGPRTRRCLALSPPPSPPTSQVGTLDNLSRGRSIITFLLAHSSPVFLFSSQNRIFFFFLICNLCFLQMSTFLFISERRLILLITRTFSLSRLGIMRKYRIVGNVTKDRYGSRTVKGTVSRDFSLLVFFINQFPPSPRVSH